ncbi:hypothetical protein EVJ32_05140 [Exiguobacterium sp. SH5S4]|uniref:phage distal tail protein n=1 Tax=Exiguobacterium sp. SH5S4 TaxID=2510961 RepID=UPI00103A775F|nr:phage tail domain-containing protein [Exiguobacterium sp. SH5S4]TCI26763.1 hypothetical protein EVJ32_05140 [Exiguobacterium sp. SH5S4]
MKHFMGFNYDGRPSYEFGLVQVSVNGGLFEDDMMSSRTLETEQVRGSDETYLKHVTRDTISFEMTLYFEDGFDRFKLDKVLSWLDKDYYKPFYFDEMPDRIIWAMVESSPRLSHDGIGGYFTVNVRANSSYWHTPVVAIEYEDSGDYQFVNKGITLVKPIYELYARTNITADNPFRMKNLRTNEEMVVHEMAEGEKMVIDTNRESVESSLPNVYRYDSWNENYMWLATGNNLLELSGDVHLVIKYREKYR